MEKEDLIDEDFAGCCCCSVIVVVAVFALVGLGFLIAHLRWG